MTHLRVTSKPRGTRPAPPVAERLVDFFVCGGVQITSDYSRWDYEFLYDIRDEARE